MGWNPNVKVNATTIETAKSRLSTLLSKELTEVYDISNLNEISVENPEPVPNLVPIYFLFVHEKPELDGMIPKYHLITNFTILLRKIILTKDSKFTDSVILNMELLY